MDDKILALLSAGDAEGVTLLQKQYGPMVQYIVRGILRDTQDTEECVSDVWMHVWERFASFDRTKGTLAAWMTVVARNAAVDRLRRRRAPDEAWDEQTGASPSPEEEVLRRERTRLLQKAVDALGASEQLLFYRKYYYLQSTAVMGGVLGVCVGGVEGRLYRLRRHLQKALGGDAL